MLTPIYTKQFGKDLKKILRSGKNIRKFKAVIERLISEEKLELKYKDHKLISNYKDRRECHIESDWLVVYKINKPKIIFERTGSHSEIFK